MAEIKGWKKIGTDFWEHKKRGRWSIFLLVERHPMDKKYWTVNYGQAPINMLKFKTKPKAVEYAVDLMKREVLL